MVEKRFNKLGMPDIERFENYLPTAFSSELTLLQKVNKIIQDLIASNKLTNEMVDYLNNFIETFDEKLYETLDDILSKWLEDGVLTDLIREVINEEVMEARTDNKGHTYHSLKDRLDSELEAVEEFKDETEKIFNNVSAMVNDSTLKKNSIVRTLGYYTPNGNGGCSYIISDSIQYDGLSVILSNGLYANPIILDKLDVGICGAYGDGINDDSLAFTKAINFFNEYGVPIYLRNNCDYIIESDLPACRLGFVMYSECGSNGFDTDVKARIIDRRSNSSNYLISISNKQNATTGGYIANIEFITTDTLDLKCINIVSRGWTGTIENCSFYYYEQALKAKGDDYAIINCKFSFCGTKALKDIILYGVELIASNEKRFTSCHFEHSRFFIEITDSSYFNNFVNCKFEIGTVYSNIKSNKPVIKVDSASANYTVAFTNCAFHMLDIEYFIERVGYTSYSDTPYFIEGNLSSNMLFSDCTFVSGPGSGDTTYKQFSQSRFIKGTFAQINNCAILFPSYLTTSINVTNLQMNNCSVTVKTSGCYCAGSFSESIPIISTEYGQCNGTFFTRTRGDIDKYYRLFNKNFKFKTPRNTIFNRGNELYASTVYIVVKTHENTFAYPYELMISNKTSGNFYGYVRGHIVSWTGSMGGSAKTYSLHGGGTATGYIMSDATVIKLSGFNSLAGAHIDFNFLETLPYDWYLTTDYDVTGALYTTEITT